MTLVVGILCEGSVVVGADGAATLGANPRAPTTHQTIKKLTRDDNIILGVSGSVGMAQLLRDRLTTGRHTLYKSPTDAMRKIREKFKPELQKADDGPTVSLIALRVSMSKKQPGTPTLFELSDKGDPESATHDIPFMSIGSGKHVADPFLAFIRRVFWPDRLPDTQEGLLAVTWTLRYVIDGGPGALGVDDPIQLMVLRSDGAHDVTDDEGALHEDNVQQLETYLGEYSIPSPLEPPPFP